MSGRNQDRKVFTNFATPQTVSTLTVVMPWTDVTPLRANAFLLAVINLSASETLTATFDTSQDGASPDSDKQYVMTVPPLGQASMEAGPFVLRSWFRISANTQSPSFNPAQVKWQLSGYWWTA